MESSRCYFTWLSHFWIRKRKVLHLKIIHINFRSEPQLWIWTAKLLLPIMKHVGSSTEKFEGNSGMQHHDIEVIWSASSKMSHLGTVGECMQYRTIIWPWAVPWICNHTRFNKSFAFFFHALETTTFVSLTLLVCGYSSYFPQQSCSGKIARTSQSVELGETGRRTSQNCSPSMRLLML